MNECTCSKGSGFRVRKFRRWLYVHLGIGHPSKTFVQVKSK